MKTMGLVKGGFLLAAALLAAGCAPSEDTSQEEEGRLSEAESVSMPLVLTEEEEWGRELYRTFCSACHGTAGRGDGPRVAAGGTPQPPDFTTGEYARRSGEELEEAFLAIADLPRPIHPYMRMVQDLAEPEAFVHALHYIAVIGYPEEVPGSALAGREIYRDRCVACHGYRGRGDGRATEYGILSVSPPDFTSDTLIARGDFEALFNRVKEGGGPVHGSSMPAWRLALSDDEIWDLVAFVVSFQPEILSDPR